MPIFEVNKQMNENLTIDVIKPINPVINHYRVKHYPVKQNQERTLHLSLY
jgi:hypothetical protein